MDGYSYTSRGFIGYNMFAYCLNDPVYYADYSGNAAGWSNIVYDRGGCGNRDDDEVEITIVADNKITESFCTEVLYSRYDNWGAYPPEEVIVECRKSNENYVYTLPEDAISSLFDSSISGFGASTATFAISKLIGHAINPVLSFLIGFGIDYVLGFAKDDIPIGVHDIYVVTVSESYRLVDPHTGQTYGWQYYSETRPFILSWIEVELD